MQAGRALPTYRQSHTFKWLVCVIPLSHSTLSTPLPHHTLLQLTTVAPSLFIATALTLTSSPSFNLNRSFDSTRRCLSLAVVDMAACSSVSVWSAVLLLQLLLLLVAAPHVVSGQAAPLRLANPSAPFGMRFRTQVTSFYGRILLFSGIQTTGALPTNDLWSSADDGASWSFVGTSGLNGAQRYDGALVTVQTTVNNTQLLLLFGGYDGSNNLNTGQSQMPHTRFTTLAHRSTALVVLHIAHSAICAVSRLVCCAALCAGMCVVAAQCTSLWTVSILLPQLPPIGVPADDSRPPSLFPSPIRAPTRL